MTTIETLNKVAQDCSYEKFFELVEAYKKDEETDITLIRFVRDAMRLYAAQFINAANDIINPATEILPDTYDEDYEKWYETVLINQD